MMDRLSNLNAIVKKELGRGLQNPEGFGRWVFKKSKDLGDVDSLMPYRELWNLFKDIDIVLN